VKDIHSKYAETRANLDIYDTTVVEIWGESSDGGQVVVYHNQGDIRLIEVWGCGESGKSTIEYYFKAGMLIFVIDRGYTYNRPYYWNEELAKENGDYETFDPEKTIITEDRYYFENELLFLWLNNVGIEQDLTMGTNSLVGKGLIAHCYFIKDILKK
jgi:hypothetical protein